MIKQVNNTDAHRFPSNSPITSGPAQMKQVPWQFGINQKIQAKQIKLSRVNINSPFILFPLGSASGTFGNGQTLFFNTTLVPLTPHTNQMAFAIPYAALFFNKTVGTGQIWPNLGTSLTPGAFTVQAGFDLYLFNQGTPSNTIPSFSGFVINNSGGNGTLIFETFWQYINFNTGTASNQA